MSILQVSTIEPEGATTTLTLGASGDTVTSSADAIKVNTFKDAGGNTLWTSDGSGTLSSINSSLTGGGMTLISTQSGSNITEVDFTTGIDSTYDEYWFVITDFHHDTDSTSMSVQFNASGGSGFDETMTTTKFRAQHSRTGSGWLSGVLAYMSSEDLSGATGLPTLTYAMGNEATAADNAIFKLFSPSNTTYWKQWIFRGGGVQYNSNNYTTDEYATGYIQTATAITEVRFRLTSAHNFDVGAIQLYGIS